MWLMENISKLRGDNQPLTKTFDWIEINKETINYFTGMINEELGSFISTIISNNPQGKLLGEIQPKITPINKNEGLKGSPKEKEMMVLNISFLITRES